MILKGVIHESISFAGVPQSIIIEKSLSMLTVDCSSFKLTFELIDNRVLPCLIRLGPPKAAFESHRVHFSKQKQRVVKFEDEVKQNDATEHHQDISTVDPDMSYTPEGMLCSVVHKERRTLFVCVASEGPAPPLRLPGGSESRPAAGCFALHAVEYVDARTLLWGSRGVLAAHRSSLLCDSAPAEYPYAPLERRWSGRSHLVVAGSRGLLSYSLAAQKWHLMSDAALEAAVQCLAGTWHSHLFVALLVRPKEAGKAELCFLRGSLDAPPGHHAASLPALPPGSYSSALLSSLPSQESVALLVQDALHVFRYSGGTLTHTRRAPSGGLGVPLSMCELGEAPGRLAVLCTDGHVYSVGASEGSQGQALLASRVQRCWSAAGGLALLREDSVSWLLRGAEETCWVMSSRTRSTVGLSRDSMLVYSLERDDSPQSVFRPNLVVHPFSAAVIGVYLSLGLRAPMHMLQGNPVALRGFQILVYRALLAGDAPRIQAAFSSMPEHYRQLVLLRVLRSSDMEPHWEFLLRAANTEASAQCELCIQLRQWDTASQWLRPVHLLEGAQLSKGMALQLLEAIIGAETGPAHYQLIADIVTFLAKFSRGSGAPWDVPLRHHGRQLLLGLKVSQLLHLQSLIAESDSEWLWRLLEEERSRSADMFDIWDGVAAICDQYCIPIPCLEEGRLKLTVSRFTKAELDLFLPLLVKVGCWRWAFAVAASLLRFDALTSLLKHHPKLWEDAKAALPVSSPYLAALHAVENASPEAQ